MVLMTCNATIIKNKSALITQLAYKIYRIRPDLHSTMPDIFGSDRLRFLEWLVAKGKSDHGLNDVFLQPIREAVGAARRPKRADGIAALPNGATPATLPIRSPDPPWYHAGPDKL